MIIQNIDSSNQVIFTTNPEADYRHIALALNYTKKDGELYKYVTKDITTYYPKGSIYPLNAVKLVAKNVTTYIVPDEYDFHMRKNSLDELSKSLSRFGEKSIVQFGDIELNGPFTVRDGMLITNSGKTISESESTATVSHKMISEFIHRMGTDNGKMLYPIIKRFLNTVFLFKGNKNLLTGYANLKHYLNMMRQPQPNFRQLNITSSGDYSINYDSNSLSRIKVVDVKDGIPIIKLHSANNLVVNGSITNPDPYILITTKPIQMQNQKFPYTVVRFKGTPLFISPLIFNSRAVLDQLPGGINLLK
jgi:hypothetical protein